MTRRMGQVALHTELRADVSAHSLWKQKTTTMFYIIIVNFDGVSYLHMTPKKDLAKEENNKKGLYLQPFLEYRRSFTPMVYSLDVIPKLEALAAQKRLAALISFKLKQ